MRILYISQYFPPEIGATQTRAIEMASNLVRQGHQVTVLTEFPNHPKGIIPEKYRGRFIEHDRVEGVDIIRTWVYARPNKTFLTRMGFYLSFMSTSFIAGLFLRGKFDIVYATSPPFFVGVTGLLLSRLKSARFVFEVRDLWPQSAVELGELSNKTFIRWAERLENVYYKKADFLIAVTKGIYRHLSARSYSAKVRQVLNGTNTELFYYRGVKKRQEMDWNDTFVVVYAGIIGIAQGMDQLCQLVENCKAHSGIRFVFIGEGPQKEKVKLLQERKELHNLFLLGQVPREIIPQYISAADCCLVPLKKNPLFLGALPSKMFDCMACERPVILSVDGEARRVLEESEGGIYVEPENTQQMEKAILRLKNSPTLCRKMGKAGREYVKQKFSRRQKALELEKILLEL
ncbi:MAG: glycosyltransferase [Actinobacteria bacterium]|nr:glycosyltransferase [Actinomycetota bacterium]